MIALIERELGVILGYGFAALLALEHTARDRNRIARSAPSGGERCSAPWGQGRWIDAERLGHLYLVLAVRALNFGRPHSHAGGHSECWLHGIWQVLAGTVTRQVRSRSSVPCRPCRRHRANPRRLCQMRDRHCWRRTGRTRSGWWTRAARHRHH